MKNISNQILLVIAMVTMPLHAAEMDHSSMHHEHESSTAGAMQQTQDQDTHHDQHGTSPSEHDDHQSISHETMSNDQHHGHEAMHDTTKPGLSSMAKTAPELLRLNALPPSGKSREANFDNTYFMQSTALEQPLEVKCALASRGLIMLDNDSFQKCGGKPVGWSKGITAAQKTEDHSQHMNH